MEIQNMSSVKSQLVQKNAGRPQKKNKAAGSDAVGGFQMLFGSMQTQASLRTNSSRTNSQKTLQKSGTVGSTKSAVSGNRGNVSERNSSGDSRTGNTGTVSQPTDNSWRDLRETGVCSGQFNPAGAADAKDAAEIQNRNFAAGNAKNLAENSSVAAGSQAKATGSQMGAEKSLAGAAVNGTGTSEDIIHGTAGAAENSEGQIVIRNSAESGMSGDADTSAEFPMNGVDGTSADLQRNGMADTSAGLPNGQAVSNGGRSGSQTEEMNGAADTLREAALVSQDTADGNPSGETNGAVEANSQSTDRTKISEEMADVSDGTTAGISEDAEEIAEPMAEADGKIPSETDSALSQEPTGDADALQAGSAADSSNVTAQTETSAGQSINGTAEIRRNGTDNRDKTVKSEDGNKTYTNTTDQTASGNNRTEKIQGLEKSGIQPESRKKAPDKTSEEPASAAENPGQRTETGGDGLHFRMEDTVRPAGNEIINNKTPVDESIGKVFHPVTLQTSEKKLPEDISSYLAANLKDKSGSVEITLRPENLGNLMIRVSRDGEHTRFLILAESPATMHILREHAAEMGQLIRHATGEETLISVPEREEQDGRPMEMDTEGRSQNRREQNENKKRQEKQSGQDRFLNMMRLGIAE